MNTIQTLLEQHTAWLHGEGDKPDFSSANLRGANLTDAYLRRADLTGADLTSANLLNTKISPWLICPEVGDFTAYKKALDCTGKRVVLRVRIPADAARINGIGSRKCRAERVYVVAAETETDDNIFYSLIRTEAAHYRVGEITVADHYDDDPRKECTGGIHFFMTKKEAEDYK